ncbi:TetR/AcrR family transcriptional regulator [Mycolicibacterium goodii]|uniref:TetR/AcrR family transcriptional regulator n=1 Tax=Mycolicibacterium goodii TaxID=134601 RepID=UPI000C25754E|nr:TetR/AcrR family transcriptional regulator [Mycolicibacterium goodii]PJK20440.1 TetR family transcriptional regulator [Mycolicibacterium goodii]
MLSISEAPTEVLDPRVRRSRAALFEAVIELTCRHGSTDLTTAAIAEQAGLSRQVVYQHFGDRDALVVAAALDLLRRELLPEIAEHISMTPRDRALATARHFAARREFYHAVLAGPCSVAFSRGLTELHLPVNQALVRTIFGEGYDPQIAEDLAVYLTGGGIAFLTKWVVESAEPLDSEQFVDRLGRMHAALIRTEGPKPRTEGDVK